MEQKMYINLESSVKDFLGKIEDRRNKIQTKIDSLKMDVIRIKGKIDQNAKEMVDLEVVGNSAGAAKLQKENRQLRLDVEDLNDQILGYEVQFDIVDNGKDIQTIRQLTKKAHDERMDNHDQLLNQRSKHKELIEKMERELKEAKGILEELDSSVWSSSVDRVSGLVKPLLSYISPQVLDITIPERDQFVQMWSRGESTDDFLGKIAERKAVEARNLEITKVREATRKEYQGPKITYNNPEEVEYTPPMTGGFGVPGHII